MDDKQIFDHIDALVAEEHELRARRSRREIDSAEEVARLARLEESLDQCWDLPRRRRARKDAGEDPDGAKAVSLDQVEGYLQ